MTIIPPGKVGDRFVAVFMTITLVLFAVLTGLLIYLVLRVSDVANENRATADTAQANALKACGLANQNRAEDVRIFAAILALPAIAKPQFITPAAAAVQAAAVAKVTADIRAAYAPRDCEALYKSPS